MLHFLVILTCSLCVRPFVFWTVQLLARVASTTSLAYLTFLGFPSEALEIWIRPMLCYIAVWHHWFVFSFNVVVVVIY